MQNLEIIQTMIDYNYTLHHRLWQSIMTLSDEQFVADIPYSHGSIRNHMVHLARVDVSWLRGLKGDATARSYRLNPEDYPTRTSVREVCDSAEQEVRDYLATLDDNVLASTPQGMPLPVWQTLLHLVNHGTDHRGQVLRALHDFGAVTFDQDLAFYLMAN